MTWTNNRIKLFTSINIPFLLLSIYLNTTYSFLGLLFHDFYDGYFLTVSTTNVLLVTIFFIFQCIMVYFLHFENPNTYVDFIKDLNTVNWTNVPKPKVCVVGSGVCGLTMSYALKQHKIPFNTYDRNDQIGGNWYNGVYENVNIISSRKATEFKIYPMPKSFGDFPSARNMNKYLNNFTDHYKLRDNIHLNHEVIKIEPIFLNKQKQDENENKNKNEKENIKPSYPNQTIKYNVYTKNLLSNEETNEIYDAVIYSNGHHWDKRFAGPFPNQESYTGQIMHSKDYKNPKQLVGKRVLVIGIGNSGCDIAVEAARFALKSHVSARSGKWIFPRAMGGIPMTETPLMAYLPYTIQSFLLKKLLKWYFGDYSKYGLPNPDFYPFGAHPTVNSELLNNLALQKITPHPGIKQFCGDKIIQFSDNTKIEVDLIIHACGYHVTLPLYENSKLVIFEDKKSKWTGKTDRYPDFIQGIVSPRFQNCYVFGIGQPRGGVGSLTIPASQSFIRMLWIQSQLKTPLGTVFKRVGRKPLDNYYMDPVKVFDELLSFLSSYRYLPWIAKKFMVINN